MIYDCDTTLSLICNASDGMPVGSDAKAEFDEIMRKDVWPTFFETEVGQKYKQFALTEELTASLASELTRRYGSQGEIKAGVSWPGVFFCHRLVETIGDYINARHSSLVLLDEPEQAASPAEPTADERFAALIQQVVDDIGDVMQNRIGISSAEINRKRQSSPDYAAAYNHVMQSSVSQGYGKSLVQEAKPVVDSKVAQFAHMLSEQIMQRGVPRPAAGYYEIHAGGKSYKYSIADYSDLSEKAAIAGLI